MLDSGGATSITLISASAAASYYSTLTACRRLKSTLTADTWVRCNYYTLSLCRPVFDTTTGQPVDTRTTCEVTQQVLELSFWRTSCGIQVGTLALNGTPPSTSYSSICTCESTETENMQQTEVKENARYPDQ